MASDTELAIRQAEADLAMAEIEAVPDQARDGSKTTGYVLIGGGVLLLLLLLWKGKGIGLGKSGDKPVISKDVDRPADHDQYRFKIDGSGDRIFDIGRGEYLSIDQAIERVRQSDKASAHITVTGKARSGYVTEAGDAFVSAGIDVYWYNPGDVRTSGLSLYQMGL